jgi:ferric-dicitrate binding protein FerR (iron transport regulator)
MDIIRREHKQDTLRALLEESEARRAELQETNYELQDELAEKSEHEQAWKKIQVVWAEVDRKRKECWQNKWAAEAPERKRRRRQVHDQEQANN